MTKYTTAYTRVCPSCLGDPVKVYGVLTPFGTHHLIRLVICNTCRGFGTLINDHVYDHVNQS